MRAHGGAGNTTVSNPKTLMRVVIMSTINISAFALGALVGTSAMAILGAALWPLAQWEQTARWRWAKGELTLWRRLCWRLFRPVSVSVSALVALGGVA